MKDIVTFINEASQISKTLDPKVEKIVTKLVNIIKNHKNLFGADGSLSKPMMGYWPSWIKEKPKSLPNFYAKWAKGQLTKEWDEWVLKGLCYRSPWNENELNKDYLKELTLILTDLSHSGEPLEQLMVGIANGIKRMVRNNEEIAGAELGNIFLN